MKVTQFWNISLLCGLLFLQVSPTFLTAQVTVIDLETARVNWTVRHKEDKHRLEIVYSPVRESYYIVKPILNPIAESDILENLLPFTRYQLVIRTANTSQNFLQTDTIYFSTSVATGFEGNSLIPPGDFKMEEILIVSFVLMLWGVVIRLFFQQWGKLRSLLPYQPVYSKEMVEKIEKIETEKEIRSNRTSFSFYPVDCDCGGKQGNWKAKTSSTFVLPQSSSLADQLRKTKSAEHVGCPQIVIEKTLSRQVSSSNHSLPPADSQDLLQTVSRQLLNIPSKEDHDKCSEPGKF